MKKLTFIFLILSILACAQTKPYKGHWPTKQTPIIFDTLPKLCFNPTSISFMKLDSMDTIMLTDSCKGNIAYYNDKNLVVTDSLATIKILFFFMRKKHIELMEIYDKYCALENIYRYVGSNGIIDDKAGFDNAVKRHKKVIYKYNPPLKSTHVKSTTNKK